MSSHSNNVDLLESGMKGVCAVPTEWQRCRCDSPSCSSCMAESLAVVDPNREERCSCHGYGCPGGFSGGFNLLLLSRGQQSGSHTDEYTRQMSAANTLKGFLGASSKSRKFWVVPAPGHNGSHLFIYIFHLSISDSTIDGRKEFSYASACCVLQFACNFSRNPSVLTLYGPTEEVISQIEGAMREGNASYDSEYHTQEGKEIGPEETIRLCRDYNLKQLGQRQIHAHWIPQIVDSIMRLQHGQVLLIYRWKPYKVMSVVCTAEPEAICLFDSQIHESYIKEAEGAMLFCSPKATGLLTVMLAKFEGYILPFQGHCTLVLLQVQS